MSWIEEKLTVCRYPVLNEFKDAGKYAHYDIVVNVSDEAYIEYIEELTKLGKQVFWNPMSETNENMGLHSMFAALNILYQAEKLNKSVLLHCHAGINRSQTVKACYYYMMNGHHIEEKKQGNILLNSNMLLHNTSRHLPILETTEKWLMACKEAFDNPEKFLGGMLDWTLIQCGLNPNR